MSSLTLPRLEQTLRSEEFSPRSLMKFNPSQHTLCRRVVGLNFKIGSGETDYLNSALPIGTEVRIKTNSAVNAICWDATTVYQGIKLPTIADYENLEDLNDIEQIESILYQASKKFLW